MNHGDRLDMPKSGWNIWNKPIGSPGLVEQLILITFYSKGQVY